MQPKDEDELVDMLHTSLTLPGPGFIRYPRGSALGVKIKEQPATMAIGHAEVLREGSNIMIWALGNMVQDALKLAARLATEESLSVGVVNARFVKPLDRTLLLSHAACIPLLVTMEDHVLAGGFGSAVLEVLQEAVQDYEFNITRFAIIGGTPAAGANKTTLVFALPSTPGALFKALSVFALREINLSKLESRPLRGRPWEYLFYIEVDARADEPACAEAIAQLGDFAQMLRVLGTYKGAERRWAK